MHCGFVCVVEFCVVGKNYNTNYYVHLIVTTLSLSRGLIGALGRRGGQIKEMEPKLHPDLKESMKKLSDDPKITVVVLSGSDRNILDDVVLFFFHSALLVLQVILFTNFFLYRTSVTTTCG